MKQEDGIQEESQELNRKCRTIEEEDVNAELEEAWVDVSGAEFNPQFVRRGGLQEIDYVKKMNLYTKVPISQCYEMIKRAPTSVRWIDTNKRG